MKDTDKSVQEMWERYLMTIGENPESTEMTYQSWYFCDNQEDANELVELVMAGAKEVPHRSISCMSGKMTGYQLQEI